MNIKLLLLKVIQIEIIKMLCFRYVCDQGGVSKLVALTREKDTKNEKPLRCYSEKVITEANRVRTLLVSLYIAPYSIYRSSYVLGRN